VSGDRTPDTEADDAAMDAAWREHRAFLVGLAFRMLGDFGDAEDIVQDAFTRLLRSNLDGIDDVRGWLIVVVSRLCLDELRSARSRREILGTDHTARSAQMQDPADRVSLDDNVGMALFVMLQQLSPAERTVFVLHDVFQFSFSTAASIVGRSPEACRKLASRARSRIEAETGTARFEVLPEDQQRLSERFIAACAGGDMEALIEVLDPDVVGVVDLGDGQTGPPQIGFRRVARNLVRFFGRASGVTLVCQPLNGRLGFLAFKDRELIGFMTLKTGTTRITDIHAIADPRKIALARQLLRSTH
jgi:RNA polymerase sigma-70 factor, ECF subfamily